MKAAAEPDQLSNSRWISGPPERGVAVMERRLLKAVEG
jgi:hypothetical protein